jgi:hypothetical protein
VALAARRLSDAGRRALRARAPSSTRACEALHRVEKLLSLHARVCVVAGTEGAGDAITQVLVACSARPRRERDAAKVVRQTLKGDEEDERRRARLVGNLIA